MKTLHQNRPRGQWIGGDVVQMDNTMKALAELGVDITFNDQPLFTPALLLQTYDIVHTWNFSMEWTKYQVWAAAKHREKFGGPKAIVCSMIYHETEAFIPYEHQQIMLDACDACIFLSKGEVERVRRHLTIDDSKVHIIENGIDPWWFEPTKAKNIYGDYVLTVGRIDGTKGQQYVAEVCKEIGIKSIHVGEVIDYAVAEDIKKHGGILLGTKNKEDLKPLYKHAKVFVLASQLEIFPLTIMEAGSQGTNVVLTDGSEWKEIPSVELCSYGNIESIKTAIEKSLKKPKNIAFKKILKGMTWNDVAKKILAIYEQIL